jgi:hypothetical protein
MILIIVFVFSPPNYHRQQEPEAGLSQSVQMYPAFFLVIHNGVL